jgi:hypothetical protein
MTFLLVSIGVSAANLKLRAITGANIWLVLLSLFLMVVTISLLIEHLVRTAPDTLAIIAAIYGSVILCEILFSRRRRQGEKTV